VLTNWELVVNDIVTFEVGVVECAALFEVLVFVLEGSL
jgi:hypothetical protein